MGKREEIGLRVMRQLVRRPRIGDLVFGLEPWGNIVGADRFIDPYPIYERMRESGPVSFGRSFQQWAVVGYEEAHEVLRSPKFGVADQVALLLDTKPYSDLSPASKSLARNLLLFTDPPLHTRLRGAIVRAFSPKQMKRLEPRIQQIATRLINDISSAEDVDLMATFAEPLPVQVIAELIGVPEERWGWVSDTSIQLRKLGDPFVPLHPADVDQVAEDIADYYGSLIDERKKLPTGDLLSDLAASEDQGTITRAEIISTLALLLIAGHETTTGALGSSVVALGRNPEQRQLLLDNPDLWPNAVEELLRYEAPIQTDPRTALEDVEIAGKTIKKGQNLTVMLGAANRDPSRFENPHELRLDRNDPSPLSFGFGAHFCIGAALARLELHIALPLILDALGDYQIDETKLEWKTSLAFRSPSKLPLTAQLGRWGKTVRKA